MVHRLGIQTQPYAPVAAEVFQLLQQARRHNAFSIITHDEGIGAGQTPRDFLQQPARAGILQFIAHLPIHAHYLLLVRDNPGFDAGGTGRVDDQPLTAHALVDKQLAQATRGIILANHRNEIRLGPKAERFRATLAAPPGMKLSRWKSTTGTGASGEMRFTRPQMNWSSMTSPTTRTRRRLARASNSDTLFARIVK